jgi:multidrug efflux system membrane fusion protein
VPVRVARAIAQDVPIEIAAVGNVESIRTVDVKSRVAGEIAEVAFKEGQMVAKGQLLFRIDSDALDRNAAERRANVERDIAMEQQARALLERDIAAQQQSQLEADNALRLAKDGILANERTQQLLTASHTALAAVHADQATLDAAVATLKADRARLTQTELQLSFTNIVAPLSGRAGAISVKAGSLIRDNDTTLVAIRQLSPIDISFGIPEQVLQEIRRLNAIKPLSVEATSEAGVFTGHINFVDDAVDTNTGTIRLKGEYPNSDESLWPGEFVHVRLRLRIEMQRLVVPQSAVKEGQQGKYVWSVHSNVATTLPVTVARTYKSQAGAELAILQGGLKPGDTVVTEGQMRLTPGVHVTLLSDSSLSSVQ